MNEQKLMTVKEFAQYMRISVPFAYNITNKEGFYPLIFVGAKKLIVRDALERWIAEQTQPKEV